jgi:hypothetical protein
VRACPRQRRGHSRGKRAQHI